MQNVAQSKRKVYLWCIQFNRAGQLYKLCTMIMKTQINTLVNGSSHMLGGYVRGTFGTNTKIRKEIAEKVKSENPEVMAIRVKGIELIGKASYSVSRLSVNWLFALSVSEYTIIANTSFGVSPREEKNRPYLEMNGNCVVCIHCGNQWSYVPESWIEILY